MTHFHISRMEKVDLNFGAETLIQWKKGSLSTTMEFNSGAYGIMFDVKSLKKLIINGFKFLTSSTLNISCLVYTIEKGFTSNTNDLGKWTLIGNSTVTGKGIDFFTPCPDLTSVTIDVSSTRGFYVTLETPELKYSTTNEKTGLVFERNNELGLTVGIGVSEYPLGPSQIASRLWRGVIDYEILGEEEEESTSPPQVIQHNVSTMQKIYLFGVNQNMDPLSVTFFENITLLRLKESTNTISNYTIIRFKIQNQRVFPTYAFVESLVQGECYDYEQPSFNYSTHFNSTIRILIENISDDLLSGLVQSDFQYFHTLQKISTIQSLPTGGIKSRPSLGDTDNKTSHKDIPIISAPGNIETLSPTSSPSSITPFYASEMGYGIIAGVCALMLIICFLLFVCKRRKKLNVVYRHVERDSSSTLSSHSNGMRTYRNYDNEAVKTNIDNDSISDLLAEQYAIAAANDC